VNGTDQKHWEEDRMMVDATDELIIRLGEDDDDDYEYYDDEHYCDNDTEYEKRNSEVK
jgi:hypothetical protein